MQVNVCMGLLSQVILSLWLNHSLDCFVPDMYCMEVPMWDHHSLGCLALEVQCLEVQDTAGFTREQLGPIDVSEPAKQLPVASMPAWNGFGSLEDSAQSCLHLIPKQPVKDFYKLMQKGRIVLRFATCFVETATHKLSASDRYHPHRFTNLECAKYACCGLGELLTATMVGYYDIP